MEPNELDRLVAQSIEAYNQRDPEAMIESWEPECEWHPYFSSEVEGASAYRGHEGLRQWFRDTDEMFSDVSLRVEEVCEPGDERLLVLGRLKARGKMSGAEVDSPIGQLFELRGGRILRGWAYPSHEEAKRAAEIDG
jgi:ketosteroid isomerase-like protein